MLSFVEAVSEKSLRSTVSLTASRGRGKSAALVSDIRVGGLGAVGLGQGGGQQDPTSLFIFLVTGSGNGSGCSLRVILLVCSCFAWSYPTPPPESYSNIFVTSPSPENLGTLFEFLVKGLCHTLDLSV